MPRSLKRATTSATLESISTFGELLRYLRWRAGLTQHELAMGVGYSESQIARLEGGQRLPDVLAVKTQFVEALGLQLEPALAKRLIGLAMAAHQPAGANGTLGPDSIAVARHNLPLSLTHLIARERSVETLQELLCHTDVRLITLLGPPGVGKTSLAVEAARAACDTFADGAWFVSLAPVSDPALVPAAIAQTLGLAPSQALPLASLKLHLRDKHMLLVLDNFEQLLAAATEVADILSAVPHVKIMITSRSALRVTGEYVVEVAPLSDAPAVEMFVDRAQRIRPDLVLNAQTRAIVTEICRHLDGLPLAIELAAARLRLFSPQALLARLTSEDGPGPAGALDLLSEGPRNLPERQRTLRATITWSYSLLSPSQQRLLRTLSVFAGGCSLDAARFVDMRNETASDLPPLSSNVPSLPALTADLQALVDGSLVQRTDGLEGEPRFSLLVVIREYAAEQLEAQCEADAARRRHAVYFMYYAQKRAPSTTWASESPLRIGPTRQLEYWLKHLAQEHDNFRAALVWSLRDAHDTHTGVQLAFWRYAIWGIAGDWGEATEWLERALANVDSSAQARDRARIMALLSSYLVVADTPRAVELAREALRITRAAGDRHELLEVLGSLFNVEFEQNNVVAAQAIGEERLALARHLGDRVTEMTALFALGENALVQKKLQQAEMFFENCLKLAPAHGAILNGQGMLACYRGDFERAETLCQKALADFRKSDWGHGVATVRHSLGDIALFRGSPAQALEQYREGLRLFDEVGNRQRCTWCLAGIAATLATAGQPGQAVTLWSAVEAIRATIGSPRPALRDDDYHARVDAARTSLAPDALGDAESAGYMMSFEQTVGHT